MTANAQGDRLAMFAHDLSNRLAIISGYLDLATADVADPEALKDSLARTSRAVSDLSDLSVQWMRLGTDGAGPGAHESIDLVELLRSVLARPHALHIGVDTRVLLTTVATSVVVPGERLALEQLFGNLVDNALKYSADGEGVEVDVHLHPDHVSVAVVDHGIGMSDDDQRRAFEPFHRSTDVVGRRIRGSGLGLTICRAIAQAHGGTLHIASTLGEGSRVTVRLPVPRP